MTTHPTDLIAKISALCETYRSKFELVGLQIRGPQVIENKGTKSDDVVEIRIEVVPQGTDVGRFPISGYYDATERIVMRNENYVDDLPALEQLFESDLSEMLVEAGKAR